MSLRAAKLDNQRSSVVCEYIGSLRIYRFPESLKRDLIAQVVDKVFVMNKAYAFGDALPQVALPFFALPCPALLWLLLQRLDRAQ